jgi:hypothetical protein
MSRIEDAIETQRLIFGNRIYALTEPEARFFEVCDLYNKTYERSSNKIATEIFKNLDKGQSTGQGNQLEKYVNIEIEEVIRKGEIDNTVEFKETFQFDVRTGQINKILRNEVVKSVAGFMNSKGGILLIGVEDKTKIIKGLDRDYSLISKADRNDGFQLALNQELQNKIGLENYCYLLINILTLENMEICRINVAEAKGPVFVRDKTESHFFIRRGNATAELGLEETHKYIKSKWPGP